MDDLLKAFQAELSQDLDACAADLERLRTAPDGAAALANLHRLFCSIREMSVVLGQHKLADAASRGVAALEGAQGGAAGGTARAIPVVAESLAQIRSLLQSIEPGNDGAPAGREHTVADTPTIVPDDSPAAPLPSKRSRSDAFDLVGEHDGAGAPLSAPSHAAVPPIEVGRPILGAPIAAAMEAEAGRRRPRWYRPRNILFASGGSVVAAIAAIAIVLVTADPNEYRGMFEQTIRAATGRDVSIGNVDFALSLNPTVVLENVTLANVAWGSRPQMVSAKRVEVQMALLPLFHGDYVAKRFILRGANILLETDPQRGANWTFASADSGTASGSATDAVALPRFGRLAIEESTLSYRDGATGEIETFELRRVVARPSARDGMLDIDIASIVNGQPVSLAGKVGGLSLLDGSAPYPVDLTGEVAGLSTALQGTIAQPLRGRGYSLAARASGQSLAGLGAMLAADLPPGGPLQLAARVDDADGAIRIHDITGMIGHTELSGEISVRPATPRWHIDADLASHHLDLADFIAAPSDPGSDDPRLFPAKPLPYRWIGKVDIAAKLAADELIRGDTALQAATLEGAISAGRLTLDGLRFGYAGGQVALTGTGDVNPPVPLWTLQGSARRLAGGESLRRLVGLTMISGGQADADFGLAASGRSLREIAASLDGNAGINLTDGHIDDGLMRLFLTDLTQAVAAGNRGGQLRCLTAVFGFTDGLGRSRSFVADSGAAVVVGDGDIDLSNETINMTFEPAAKDVSLAALAVPVHVTGALGDPDVTPDAVAATANVAGGAAAAATAGVAGVVGLITGENLLQDAPTASCTALPTSIAASPDSATQTKKKTTTAAPAQQATTTAALKKQSKKKSHQSTTDQILDQAGSVASSIGSSIRSGVDSVLDSASSSSSSHKTQKTKPDK